MSAVAIFLKDDAAWLVADGTTYDYSDARIESIQQKAWPIAHLNCAMAVRGPQAFLHTLLPALSAHYSSFDDLIDGVHLAAWAVHEHERDVLAEAYGNPDVELYIVGWSDSRGRAEAYAYASHSLWGAPWSRVEVGDFACAPGVDASAEDDTVAAAIDVMERQRAIRDSEGRGGVGGHVQAVAVARHGITTAILKRWPDAVGEPLGAAA